MKILKWIGRILGGLIGLIAIALIVAAVLANARANKVYAIQVPAAAIPSDAETIAEGKRLFLARGCAECHDADLSGRVMDEAAAIGVIAPSNLTSGEGGVADQYTSDEDYVRAIRHGVSPDGKSLIVMPSGDFSTYSEHDIAALIAYIKNAPPVDEIQPETRLSLLGDVLLMTGVAEVLTAETIDHDALTISKVEPGVTVEFGEYLAKSCAGCHGATFVGGPIAAAPPEWPPASNLTPDRETGLGNWSKEDFVRALREGVRPDGSHINTAMPWKNFGQMSDTELSALWLYLTSLEPQSTAANP